MRVPRLACIQVKATAPAWAACLESRFQPACIAAAAAISAIAVRLTGSPVGRARRAPGVVRSLGWRAPGIPNGPSRLLSREVLAACYPVRCWPPAGGDAGARVGHGGDVIERAASAAGVVLPGRLGLVSA